MKKEAILINAGRGGIVNEAALAQALDEGRIAAAALDVLEKEPPEISNPLFRIKQPEKLLITPHIAWASRESRERLMDGIIKNISEYLRIERTRRAIDYIWAAFRLDFFLFLQKKGEKEILSILVLFRCRAHHRLKKTRQKRLSASAKRLHRVHRSFVCRNFIHPFISVIQKITIISGIAESIPGETTVELQKLAAELEVVIIASLFEKVDAGIYFNTAAVIDADGSYLGKYRKNHIPG